MGRRDRVRYTLSDQRGHEPLSEFDIRIIMRAADDIISVAGRTMLTKILKGSRDKDILEHSLDKCPSYGKYAELSNDDITRRIDWMILHNYLEISYNGRLPMIVFSEIGWEMYKPQYAEELMVKILSVAEEDTDDLIAQLKVTNREVVVMILDEIAESRNIGLIRFLRRWELVEVKKVRAMINDTIGKLKSV